MIPRSHPTQRSNPAELWIALAILLLAALFSGAALHHAARWHPDEAFYMTFARNAAVRGDWLLTSEPVDKPPLSFYTNALALALFAVDADADGVLYLNVHKGEFVGRLPTLWMSVLLVATGMALARTLYRERRVTWLVGVLLALSPLRIAFAATAFTDPPMLLLATLSLWMAARGRWFWAGVWFIASIAAKPQSAFYLPLLVLWIILHTVQVQRGASPRLSFNSGVAITPIIRFCMPIAAGAVLLLLWDVAREAQGAVNVWVMGRANYTPLQITPFSAFADRLTALWATVRHLFGDALLTVLLLGVGLLSGWRSRLFAFWLLGFLGLHLLLTLNLFDRNLLVLLPPAALLVASGLAHIIRSHFLPVALALLMLPFAWQAAAGGYELGGDRGLHHGIDRLAAYLNEKPVATVIYDRWLDWELDYYMGAWTDKRRVYYPTPQELAAGALALDEIGTRYFVVPSRVDYAPWLSALRSAGFAVQLDATVGAFRVYALVPPP